MSDKDKNLSLYKKAAYKIFNVNDSKETKNNIDTYLPKIVDAMEKEGVGDQRMVVYALANIKVESTQFEPISEHGNKSPYKGRGFIQITGEGNYKAYGKKLSENQGKEPIKYSNIKQKLDPDSLCNKPDLANDPEIAAALSALYISDHKKHIEKALDDNRLDRARAIVNLGLSKEYNRLKDKPEELHKALIHGKNDTLKTFTEAYKTGMSELEKAKSENPASDENSTELEFLEEESDDAGSELSGDYGQHEDSGDSEAVVSDDNSDSSNSENLFP